MFVSVRCDCIVFVVMLYITLKLVHLGPLRTRRLESIIEIDTPNPEPTTSISWRSTPVPKCLIRLGTNVPVLESSSRGGTCTLIGHSLQTRLLVRRSPFLVFIHYSQSGYLLPFDKYHSIYTVQFFYYQCRNIESLSI